MLATAVAMSPVSLAVRRARPVAAGAGRRHVRAPAAGARTRARARAAARPGARPGRVRAVRHAADRPAGHRPAVRDRAAAAGPELHHLAGPAPASTRCAPALPRAARTRCCSRCCATRCCAPTRPPRCASSAPAGSPRPGEGTEPGLGDGTPAPTPWARLGAPLDGVTAAGQTLASTSTRVRQANSAAGSPAAAQLTEFLELHGALRQLIGLPSAVLARLAGGVLDLASHRLDAWVSAQATRRLATLRTRRPLGVRLGGYGVLEDVRPATAAQAASHGYIHAPSLGQAATAAVLRSGHLAHVGGPDQPLALDLSSRRVRLALALLDGVRAGQPLGRAARLPPGTRPAREPSRARPGPLHRGAAGARSAGRDHRRRARSERRERPAARRPARSSASCGSRATRRKRPTRRCAPRSRPPSPSSTPRRRTRPR